MAGLFLSIAGNPRVPDNRCQRPACGFNAAPWSERCPKCGAVTERGLRDRNPHYDHPAGGVRVKAD